MLSLIKVPAFINYVLQLHETQLVRHGMMVVGEAESGTSTSILILASRIRMYPKFLNMKDESDGLSIQRAALTMNVVDQ